LANRFSTYHHDQHIVQIVTPAFPKVRPAKGSNPVRELPKNV